MKENGYTFSFYNQAKWDGDVGFDGGIPFLYVVNKKGEVVYHGRNAAAVDEGNLGREEERAREVVRRGKSVSDFLIKPPRCPRRFLL